MKKKKGDLRCKSCNCIKSLALPRALVYNHMDAKIYFKNNYNAFLIIVTSTYSIDFNCKTRCEKMWRKTGTPQYAWPYTLRKNGFSYLEPFCPLYGCPRDWTLKMILYNWRTLKGSWRNISRCDWNTFYITLFGSLYRPIEPPFGEPSIKEKRRIL